MPLPLHRSESARPGPPTWRYRCRYLVPFAVVALLAGLALNHRAIWQPAAVASAVSIALAVGGVPALRGYQFTGWIVAAVTVSMIYPNAFIRWGSFDLRNRWLILLVIQLMMFGMGTQMRLADLKGIARAPRGVLVGIVCHFSVMPLVGFGLAKLFRFPPEIAAGIILVGSCSSGLASNVMAYLAGANLGLSVTVTAVTTLIAPFVTPLWMQALAGTLVEVKFVGMMMEIVRIVIVPIGAALLYDYLTQASPAGRRVVRGLAVLGIVWLGTLVVGGWSWMAVRLSENAQLVVGTAGFMLAAVLAGAVYHVGVRRFPAVHKNMPFVSMIGIVYFIVVTTAVGRDNLLQVGSLLFIAAALHNAAGYFFGYWLSRGAGLDENSARSVAFEVGLQNGGMASGIAGVMGKLATVGLAPAIFGPWMNVSGSILANYWRKHPATDSVEPETGRVSRTTAVLRR